MKAKVKIRKQVKDEQSNAITVMENGRIYLYLNAIKNKRFLGTVDFKNRVFEVRRERNKHLFNKLNAYGFCHYVLDKGSKLFDLIKLNDEYGEYLFLRTEVLERKLFLTYSKIGFERQIFYPLDVLEKHATKELQTFF